MTTKILCATDGSIHSEAAVDLAATLAANLGVPVTFCMVSVGRGTGRGPLIYSQNDEEIGRILATATETAKAAGVKSITEVALKSREAAAALVQYAEENGFDHIITGTGDKHGVSRLVLGSVAADVASRAHCTVTVVR